MSNPIVTFLEGRKQKPLKEGKKPAAEIESDYSTLVWVANAAQRASQLSLVSHPAKFSHPDARATPVLFVGEYRADGFLRSGNACAGQDVVGNAAALDVYAFLSLPLEDGNTVLQHFEAQTQQLKGLLGADEDTFQTWRKSFLQIKNNAEGNKTHPNVKQVYFPVKDAYHLLSVLYPSGLMTEHRERLRRMKLYAPEVKEAKAAEKQKLFHAQGYAEMPNMLIQHFGGTKPQNISKLNSNSGGEAWLLPCFPPELNLLRPPLPKKDFFSALRLNEEGKVLFKSFRDLLIAGKNNSDITRERFIELRDDLLNQLFNWVLFNAGVLQNYSSHWSSGKGFALPIEQRVWLDSAYFSKRSEQAKWQETIAENMVRWLVRRHKWMTKGHPIASYLELGEKERDEFQPLALQCLRQMEDSQ